jgi:hypothetical protein
MAVAMVALIFASAPLASGAPAAFLAKALGLNGKQKREVRSIADTQISDRSHGLSVRSAANATSAAFATNAGTATNANKAATANEAMSATNALVAEYADSAGTAESLAGQVRSGLARAALGQKVPLVSFYVFALSLSCRNEAGNPEAVIEATSSEAESDGYGTRMSTPGTSYAIMSVGPSATFAENNDNAADFLTPRPAAFVVDLTAGINYLGAACYADALVNAS